MNDAHSPTTNKPLVTSPKTEQYIITIEQQKIPFDPADKTLLNSLEKNNVDVHYHCRDGFCGACRVTLTCGQVEYPNGEPLAFVGDNEILTCCSIPVSDISLINE